MIDVNVPGMSDHDRVGAPDCSITMRLRSTADLAAARRRLCAELEAARIHPITIDELVLASSELLTNALEAAEPGTEVAAVLTTITDPSHPNDRRVSIDIVNTGDPLPGRLVVDRNVQIGPRSHRGRGLVLAAQMGDLVIEGLVGGTRARLERTVDLA